jgi:glyoxylase I family protein
MFRRIDHVEIVPRDLDRSMKFYTDILGFRIRDRRKVEAPPIVEVIYLTLGDTVLELLSVSDAEPEAGEGWRYGYRMMAIEVEDMDRALAWLETRGVEAAWGPVSLGASRRAEIRDPDGLPIELRQW